MANGEWSRLLADISITVVQFETSPAVCHSCMRGFDKVSIRVAVANDKTAVAGVHVRSWQVGYRGLIPENLLGQMRAEDRAAHYKFGAGDTEAPLAIVATEGEDVLGFATLGRSSDVASFNEGEIFALYVDPESWGKGVGRALLLSAHTRLQEMAFTTANLWVLEGNQRAVRFYENNGWSTDGSSREEAVWGVMVKEVRYTRSMSES